MDCDTLLDLLPVEVAKIVLLELWRLEDIVNYVSVIWCRDQLLDEVTLRQMAGVVKSKAYCVSNASNMYAAETFADFISWYECNYYTKNYGGFLRSTRLAGAVHHDDADAFCQCFSSPSLSFTEKIEVVCEVIARRSMDIVAALWWMTEPFSTVVRIAFGTAADLDGFPMNTHVELNIAALLCRDEEDSLVTERVMKKYGKFLHQYQILTYENQMRGERTPARWKARIVSRVVSDMTISSQSQIATCMEYGALYCMTRLTICEVNFDTVSIPSYVCDAELLYFIQHLVQSSHGIVCNDDERIHSMIEYCMNTASAWSSGW